jgi:hypothetical protein
MKRQTASPIPCPTPATNPIAVDPAVAPAAVKMRRPGRRFAPVFVSDPSPEDPSWSWLSLDVFASVDDMAEFASLHGKKEPWHQVHRQVPLCKLACHGARQMHLAQAGIKDRCGKQRRGDDQKGGERPRVC